VSRHYGIKRQPQPRWDHGPLSRLAQRAGSALHRRLEASLLLLADLLRVHRKAAGVSLGWEPLAQAAQAMKERALLELTQSCHPQTLRRMRWANATSRSVRRRSSPRRCAERAVEPVGAG
jgi:hypothetical protein